MLLKLKKNRKGFTLIELIVVIAILGILAAIAVPNYLGMQAKATQGVYTANASAWAGAINTFNALQTTEAAKIGGTGGIGTGFAAVSGALSGATMAPTFSSPDTTGSMGFQKVKITGTVATVDLTVTAS